MKGTTPRFLNCLNVRICSSATLDGGGVEGGPVDSLLLAEGMRECAWAWLRLGTCTTYALSFSENSKPRSSSAAPTVCLSLEGTRMKSV